MRPQSTLFASLILVIATYELPAMADISPPDACTSQGPGSACSNAGPNYDEPGVCTTESCEHPGPDGSTSYICVLCELSDAASSQDSAPPPAADASLGDSAAPPAADASSQDSGAPPTPAADAGSAEDSAAPPAPTADAGSSHDAGVPPATGAAPSSSSGGCMYSAGTTKGMTGFAMFLVGIAGLALGRRRRA